MKGVTLRTVAILQKPKSAMCRRGRLVGKRRNGSCRKEFPAWEWSGEILQRNGWSSFGCTTMADSVGEKAMFPLLPWRWQAHRSIQTRSLKTSSSPCHHFSRQAAIRSWIDSWGCLESCWLSFAFYMFMNTARLLLVLMEAVCCSTIIPHRVINSIPVSLHSSGTFIFLPDYTHAEFELHRCI